MGFLMGLNLVEMLIQIGIKHYLAHNLYSSVIIVDDKDARF